MDMQYSSEIDRRRLPPEALADPKAFGEPDRIIELYAYLRREAQMVRAEPVGYRPFYVATRAKDIREIELDTETYLAGPRTVLLPEKVEAFYQEKFDNPNGTRPLTHMDGDYHREHRAVTLDWFKPGLLKTLRPQMVAMARKYLKRLETSDGQIDFASEIAYWYPLEVVLSMMGVPEQDNPYLLLLTQRLFSPSDKTIAKDIDPSKLSPHAQSVFGQHGKDAVSEFAAYFDFLTKERQKTPQNDIISTIANSEVFGGPMAPYEMTSYYIVLATGGHDSTAASLCAGLQALYDNPDELAKLRADRSLLSSFADECVRWTSPVKHFIRTPTKEVEWYGQKISAGESIMLCYASASRDEAAFEDANSFRVDRKSSPGHLGFGVGPHLCIGRILARYEIECMFEVLLDMLESFEPAGKPTFIESTFVTGHKTMPIRYELSS